MGQEEYDRVYCMFMTFDTDDSGQLNKSELRRLCKYMNYPNRPEDIDTMFAAMDTDGSGSLDFQEFVSYMKDCRPKPEILYGLTNEQYQQIMMLFHTYDDNGDGIFLSVFVHFDFHFLSWTNEIECKIFPVDLQRSRKYNWWIPSIELELIYKLNSLQTWTFYFYKIGVRWTGL